jgi:hypothetical protein
LWGSALGKAICGLRVVGKDGQVPGFPRALLRAAIYIFPMILPSLLYLALVSKAEMETALARGDELITDWVWWLVFALLFVTMRRHNGYAAIHDLLSGTRVIIRPRTQRRLPFNSAGESVSEALRRVIGPYEIRSSLWKTQDEELLLAVDPALRRNVWIHLRPASAPPLDPARRDLSRPARLRWLNGGELESKRWEAYEAPAGGPFRPAAWNRVRFWLLDLAEELAAAIEDPPTRAPCSLAHVWITTAGRALLLDLPAVATITPLDVNSMQTFLAQFADAALDPAAPPPPDATAFLGALKRHAFDRPEFVIGNLSVLVTKPPEIAPAWRAMSLLFLPACFALLGMIVAGIVNFEKIRWDRAWTSRYPGRPSFLHAAQIYLGLAEENDQTHDLRMARAYLVNHFTDVITNQTFWSSPELAGSFGAHERKLIRKAMTEPAPTPDVAQESERIVPKWIAKEEQKARRIPIGVFFGTILFGLVCAATVELFAAAIFRRSFVLNLFGIAVVNRTGQLAPRRRLLARWTIASLPVLVLYLIAVVILTDKGTLAFLSSARSVLGIAAGILIMTAIAYAIKHPSRSLADRLTRTHLVPK